MQDLNADADKFTALDSVVYPILADNEKGAKALASECDECKIPIRFDRKKTVLKSLKQEVIISKLGRMPAVIIVDKKGMIQYAYFGESMPDIPPNPEILGILKGLQGN